ncbi:hypothetical protein FFWV33_10160 [Flavobacterium faecale]|uniref:ATP F0F1 synthase synthase n=1 Tax=Flavobacterium faecale TaxID=1355330 RepID=A0A2S1LDS4_9FLAO|nr:hypothetical protein [Flavobacterium faecale]AWG21868.1 hypothetical protein FFWV33_10160 [Flavobacterium faecale]
MNHLLAKTKGRTGDFFKVISNEEIFALPDDLDNPIEYNSDYKLEDDEWFAIEAFSEKEYCIDFLTHRFISTDYNQLPVTAYNNINYLCAYQTGIYYFQKLTSSQVIQKKYFSCSIAPTLVVNEPIIVINNYPDAIYIKTEDILYFKRLTSLTTIFNGIDELYKEATQEETEAFLLSDFISLDINYSAESVKKANRKRIAMAMETLQRFTPIEKSEIFIYIREYCEDLNFDENDENFTISTEDELKKLLFGIEQRYYTTRQGNERRLANSVTTI